MAVREFQSCDFLLNNGADLRISRPFGCAYSGALLTNGVPSTFSLVIATSGVSGNTITLTDDANRAGAILPINTELSFGGNAVVTNETVTFAGNGDTITLVDASALTDGDTATYTQLVPIYSINQADSTINQNELEDRNFRSGTWVTRRITNRSASLSASGVYVRKDPGLYLARLAAFGIDRIYFELQEGDEATAGAASAGGDVGLKGWATLNDYQETRQNDQHKQISFTLNVDGAPTDYVIP